MHTVVPGCHKRELCNLLEEAELDKTQYSRITSDNVNILMFSRYDVSQVQPY